MFVDAADNRPNGYGNRYPATCKSCGQRVEVGQGWTDWVIQLGKKAWWTVHFQCPLAEIQP